MPISSGDICYDCEIKEKQRKEQHKQLFGMKKQKDDQIVLKFSKGAQKYCCKDYVVYKRDWLKKHFAQEYEIMSGLPINRLPKQQIKQCVQCSTKKRELHERQIRNLMMNILQDILELDCLENNKKYVERSDVLSILGKRFTEVEND
jgi:hypothetical protein